MAQLKKPTQAKKTTHEDKVFCLYYWAPTDHNWGHVSLKLSDGTYISWWPNGSDKKHQGLVPAKIVADWVPFVKNNTLERDTKDEGSHPAVLQIPNGCLDENRIQRWWAAHQQNNGYNGVRLNCSTTVFLALKYGGSEKYCADPKNWYWTPDRCLQYTRVMKQKMMEKELKSPGSIKFQAEGQELQRLKQIADQKAAQLKKAPTY